MRRIAIGLCSVFAACSGAPTGGGDGGASGGSAVVINELNPYGPSGMDPDWVELKNLGKAPLDLTGYKIRDKDPSHAFRLPDGTSLPAGGYLVVYCDDQVDGGVPGGIHVPWKLSGKNGDEVHLLNRDDKDADTTSFPAVLAAGRSWGRLPDGTGQFVPLTPTRGAVNF